VSRRRTSANAPPAPPTGDPPTSAEAAAPLGTAPSTPAPAWDGRRTHVVDRAADYVALHAQGLTVAQIARRRRRSKGYVSILLRLGQVLATLPPGEVAAYRSPRITWALAQRVVRSDTPPVEVRAQLRYALGGFSTHNIDRRRRGLRAPRGARGGTVAPAPDATDAGALPAPARPAPSPAPDATGILAGWGFDQALFEADPLAFARAHLERIAAVHHALSLRATRVVRQRAAERLAVGQSLRQLGRTAATPGGARRAAALAGGAPPSADTLAAMHAAALAAAPPDQRAVLTAFATFEAALRAAVQEAVDAVDRAAAAGGSRAGGRTPPSAALRAPVAAWTVAPDELAEALEEALDDAPVRPGGPGALRPP
jgi:hypothetical protein